ncbi:MAG: PhnD/SsuA/transferrin family substrate-binding protein [Aquificaceae bacterium]|nr:PhnD/SsuA/transferrin family substrate-binding protein [Aquificaceae bacterium]
MIKTVIILILFFGVSFSQVVRFAPLPASYSEELTKAYLPLIKLLEKKTGLTFEFKHYKTYDELFDKFMKGELDVITACTLSYYNLKKKYKHAKAIASFKRDPQGAAYSCVMFSAIDGPNKVENIRKPLALPQKGSTCGYFSASIILSERGKSIEKQGYKLFLTHDDAVKAVLMGKHEAGVVSKKTFEKYKGFGLKLLAESPKWPSLPVVVNTKTLSPELIKKIEDALLSITQEEQKELIEGKFGFAKVTEEDFKVVEKYKRHIPK